MAARGSLSRLQIQIHHPAPRPHSEPQKSQACARAKANSACSTRPICIHLAPERLLICVRPIGTHQPQRLEPSFPALPRPAPPRGGLHSSVPTPQSRSGHFRTKASLRDPAPRPASWVRRRTLPPRLRRAVCFTPSAFSQSLLHCPRTTLSPKHPSEPPRPPRTLARVVPRSCSAPSRSQRALLAERRCPSPGTPQPPRPPCGRGMPIRPHLRLLFRHQALLWPPPSHGLQGRTSGPLRRRNQSPWSRRRRGNPTEAHFRYFYDDQLPSDCGSQSEPKSKRLGLPCCEESLDQSTLPASPRRSGVWRGLRDQSAGAV